MKFAKIAASLIGIANAATMGGLSAHTTTSGGHSAKKVTDTVHCGQYPYFIPKYKNPHGTTTFNGLDDGKFH